MKKLTCEMCGSNELVKQDGMFVCQSCGTKYSVEEAKKMMIEGTVDVSGSTVKVSSVGNIDNYYSLASNAYDSDNNKEAESYCNKIIEIDPNNCKAWYLKGLSVGWSSTLSNDRMWEAKNCFEKAISFAKGEEESRLQEKSVTDILELFIAMIDLRGKNYIECPSPENCDGMMNKYHQLEDFSSGFKDGTEFKKLCNIQIQDATYKICKSIVDGFSEMIKDRDILASNGSCKNFLIQSQPALSAFESIVDKINDNSYKIKFYETMINMQHFDVTIVENGAKLNYSSCKSIDVYSMKNKINKWNQKIKQLDPNYIIPKSSSSSNNSMDRDSKIGKIFGKILLTATIIGGLIYILWEIG